MNGNPPTHHGRDTPDLTHASRPALSPSLPHPDPTILFPLSSLPTLLRVHTPSPRRLTPSWAAGWPTALPILFPTLPSSIPYPPFPPFRPILQGARPKPEEIDPQLGRWVATFSRGEAEACVRALLRFGIDRPALVLERVRCLYHPFLPYISWLQLATRVAG